MDRRKKKRPRRTNPRILVLCDGDTEKNYFTGLKQDREYRFVLSAVTADVVRAKNRDPLQIVEEAIGRQERATMKGNAYDSICVVFDHDNRSNRGEAYTAALQAGFGIAFSSMAFEYWYLLHFVQTTRPFPTGADLIKELKKHYPNYEKGKQNDFNLLKPFLEKANANAIWSRGQMEEQLLQGTFLIDLNPYTDVDLLVGFLVGLK